ncbi:hypothetical protein VTH06DRAFT_8362 [Thermothelomyces fergusii]
MSGKKRRIEKKGKEKPIQKRTDEHITIGQDCRSCHPPANLGSQEQANEFGGRSNPSPRLPGTADTAQTRHRPRCAHLIGDVGPEQTELPSGWDRGDGGEIKSRVQGARQQEIRYATVLQA